MKTNTVIILLILVAVASSAATLGIQKLIAMGGGGGKVVLITDKRCAECDTTRLETAIGKTFPEAQFEVLDYGQRKGKKLYESENVKLLPAVLMPKSYAQLEEFKRVERFAQLGKNYYLLKAGGKFDPNAEICDNEIDDNGDKLVDCADPTCKTNWLCMEKRETPDVDVFVMSHCPFGTQIEKGVLPVWDLFGDKINLNLRFVDYAMHGKKEIDEQLKQYCVGEQGKGKLRKYLECFLKDGKADNKCMKVANADSAALKGCIVKSDKEFGVTKSFKDKSKWKGRFPPFPVDAKLARKYGVKGSPTLVINDVVVKAGRSPKAIQDAVCKAFETKPPECDKALDAASPSPGFGFKKGAKAASANAACGG